MKISDYINGVYKTSMSKLTIERIINESIEEVKQEKQEGNKKQKLKVTDELVKQLMSNDKFKKKAMKYLTDEDAYDGWSDNLKGKKYTSLSNLSDGSKRREVTQRLKDDKIKYAPMAYELWPEMSEDAARSWFSKKVDGKNESFSDEEIETLYSLLNNKL